MSAPRHPGRRARVPVALGARDESRDGWRAGPSQVCVVMSALRARAPACRNAGPAGDRWRGVHSMGAVASRRGGGRPTSVWGRERRVNPVGHREVLSRESDSSLSPGRSVPHPGPLHHRLDLRRLQVTDIWATDLAFGRRLLDRRLTTPRAIGRAPTATAMIRRRAFRSESLPSGDSAKLINILYTSIYYIIC
jgi:hypothetical protein